MSKHGELEYHIEQPDDTSVTVAKGQRMKARLEQQILSLVDEFQRASGLTVADIHVVHEKWLKLGIEVDVKL